MTTITDFTVKDIRGNDYDLKQHEGSVLLIVNTASKCGFTPQFEGLEELWQKYKDRDVVVIGFPCNQFGNQDPGSGEEIQEFCSLNYGVSFPMMEKVDVNGANAAPIFKWLRRQAGGLFGDSVKWNFTKFLVHRDGETVERFAPTTSPEQLHAKIDGLLSCGQ